MGLSYTYCTYSHTSFFLQHHSAHYIIIAAYISYKEENAFKQLPGQIDKMCKIYCQFSFSKFQIWSSEWDVNIKYNKGWSQLHIEFTIAEI